MKMGRGVGPGRGRRRGKGREGPRIEVNAGLRGSGEMRVLKRAQVLKVTH